MDNARSLVTETFLDSKIQQYILDAMDERVSPIGIWNECPLNICADLFTI